MPETIRSLAVVLFFSLFGFYFLSKVAKSLDYRADLKRLQTLWISVSAVAFLSNNYWLFLLISGAFVAYKKRPNGQDRIADYFVLVLCLPVLANSIPGFGGIHNLFNISWPRLSVLILLLPLLIKNDNLKPNQYLFRMSPDVFVISYILLVSVLGFRETTFTEGVRVSIYSFLDIFLPYYAISRYVTSIESYKKIFFSIFLSVFIMALIAIFESIKSWHIYDSLKPSLGFSEGLSNFKSRSGILRANAAFGSIHLGYVVSVSIVCGYFLLRYTKVSRNILLVFFILFIALLATLSRGPWVGFFIMSVSYLLLGRDGITRSIKVLLVGFVLLPLIALSPVGQKFLDLLPFVGNTDTGTVSYRQRLFEQSIKVIEKHPFFGLTSYRDTPEMQSMIQGEGIIDMVNTYLQVALENGLIGLFLFVAIFISIIVKIYKLRPKLQKYQHTELIYLGNTLIAILVGTLITIATVSTMAHGISSILYWAFVALAAAYIDISKGIIIKQAS